MRFRGKRDQQRASYVFRGIAILICGVGGAWFCVDARRCVGLDRVDGAIVTAIIGMVAATLCGRRRRAGKALPH
jgi:hypothetical protein